MAEESKSLRDVVITAVVAALMGGGAGYGGSTLAEENAEEIEAVGGELEATQDVAREVLTEQAEELEALQTRVLELEKICVENGDCTLELK